MKNLKKVVLLVLCFSLMFGVTACASRDNNTINDATDHTGKNNAANDMSNAFDNVGNAVGDGINAVGDGMKDVTDDLTGHTNNTSRNYNP